MALVGSGSNRIQNFLIQTALSAADFDQSFAAIVDQVGGIYWTMGTSMVKRGNLSRADNFAASLSIQGSAVNEHRTVSAIIASNGFPNGTVREHFIRIDKKARLEWVAVSYGSIIPALGSAVSLWLNGVPIAGTVFDGRWYTAVVDIGKDVDDATLLRVDCYHSALSTITVTAYVSRDHVA